MVRKRFGTLWLCGKVISILGILTVPVGILIVALGFYKASDAAKILSFAWGFSTILSGIFVMGFGEALQCFVAIEENTRTLAGSHADSREKK